MQKKGLDVRSPAPNYGLLVISLNWGMIYARSQEVFCTLCKGLGCCGTDRSVSLRRGPVPLQTLLHPVLSSFSLKTFGVFQLQD